tara:strand:+ start:66 stop:248 length:183 start_codon:yes stop_codon:yes gene_type:complete
MKVGDLVKRLGGLIRAPHPELGVIVGFEEGPIQAPYVRWLDGFYVSLEERCMVEVLGEEN